MVNREFEPRLNINESSENQNTYQQRVSELKSSEYFWDKDRIIHPDVFKYLLIGIAIVLISACIWVVCLSFINDSVITAIVLLITFSFVSIIIQPYISNRIVRKFIRFKDSTIVKVDLLKNMTCFFYKDIETGKLHEEILFIENNGTLSAFGTFKVDTVPIGISGEFTHFVRAIYAQQIPFFWNYVQAPITEKQVMRIKNVSLDMRKMLVEVKDDERNNFILNKEGIWEARIIFGTSDSKRIRNNATETLKILYDSVSTNMKKLESAFQVNFPHSKVVVLKDKDIISAIITQLTNGGQFRFF